MSVATPARRSPRAAIFSARTIALSLAYVSMTTSAICASTSCSSFNPSPYAAAAWPSSAIDKRFRRATNSRSLRARLMTAG